MSVGRWHSQAHGWEQGRRVTMMGTDTWTTPNVAARTCLGGRRSDGSEVNL